MKLLLDAEVATTAKGLVLLHAFFKEEDGVAHRRIEAAIPSDDHTNTAIFFRTDADGGCGISFAQDGCSNFDSKILED